METGTVTLSQSTRAESPDTEWVSNWERELAWDATFGNRRRMPWPYQDTSLRQAIGDNPSLGRQIADAFSELREPVSAVSHLFGVFLGLSALIVMTTAAVAFGGALHVACAAVFGGSLVVAYLASALHHSLRVSDRPARFLARADRAGVAVLFAGTLTPLFLIGVGGPEGAVAWIAGALLYALAAFIGRVERPSFTGRLRGHEVAHLLMLAGSACHVWAVFRHYLLLA